MAGDRSASTTRARKMPEGRGDLRSAGLLANLPTADLLRLDADKRLTFPAWPRLDAKSCELLQLGWLIDEARRPVTRTLHPSLMASSMRSTSK